MKKNALDNGFQLAAFDIISSTNEEAKKLAEEGAPSGTVVWSKTQTAGRGRQGTKWFSPPGNLYLSLLLRMDCDAKIVSELVFLSALAVRDALPKVNLLFKWPNDILSRDARKLAGILLDAKAGTSGKADWVVIGVGVNIASHPADKDVDRPATCLKKLGRNMEVDELLQAFLDKFSIWYNIWNNEGFAPIRKSWKKNAAFLGEQVNINLNNKLMTATFKDINETGELVIILPGGEEISISAGDMFLGETKKK